LKCWVGSGEGRESLEEKRGMEDGEGEGERGWL